MDPNITTQTMPGRNTQIRYTDLDGKRVRISAGTSDPRKVKEKIEEIRVMLRRGEPVLNQRQKKKYRPNQKQDTKWSNFVEVYKQDVLTKKAETTQDSEEPILDVFTRIFGSATLRQICEKEFITQTKKDLYRGKGSKTGKPRTVATVNCYLRVLRCAMNYAVDGLGWLDEKPKISAETERDEDSLAKGRPVTEEEVELMVEACDKVCRHKPEEYANLIRGMFLSGLRLGEAMRLTFDDKREIHIRRDSVGNAVVFPASKQKNKKRQQIPALSGFLALIDSFDRSSGFVFCPTRQDGKKGRPTLKTVGTKISEIGEAAGVIVNDHGSYAGAHSLRRGFAQYWADRGIIPKDLQLIMRHRELNTTMKYYVTNDVAQASARIERLQ